MLAGLMALNAFAIDAMIPALADIGRSLHVVRENDQQLVVIAYFLGFASTQLVWGPLADRFGRKPVLGIGIVLVRRFRPALRVRRELPPADRRAVRDGRVGRGDPGPGRRDGPRPVRGRSHGAGDEPRVHDLHAGAGARAEHRPG